VPRRGLRVAVDWLTFTCSTGAVYLTEGGGAVNWWKCNFFAFFGGLFPAACQGPAAIGFPGFRKSAIFSGDVAGVIGGFRLRLG
jgi:hypothetical protein